MYRETIWEVNMEYTPFFHGTLFASLEFLFKWVLRDCPSKGVSFSRNCSAALVGVLQDNLVLSTELTMWISHHREIRKLTFRALTLLRSESRNCELCVVYIQKDGATLLVGAWQREKQQNKLVEWKVFVDTGREAADCHIVRIVWSSGWV